MLLPLEAEYRCHLPQTRSMVDGGQSLLLHLTLSEEDVSVLRLLHSVLVLTPGAMHGGEMSAFHLGSCRHVEIAQEWNISPNAFHRPGGVGVGDLVYSHFVWLCVHQPDAGRHKEEVPLPMVLEADH